MITAVGGAVNTDINDLNGPRVMYLERCLAVSSEGLHCVEVAADDNIRRWINLGKKTRMFGNRGQEHAEWLLRRSPHLRAKLALSRAVSDPV